MQKTNVICCIITLVKHIEQVFLLKTYSLSIEVRDSLGSSVNYTLRKMKQVCSSARVIAQPQNLMHAT